MNRKEIKSWVKDAIKKGYDRSDVSDLMEGQVEAGKLTMEQSIEVMNVYDEQTANADGS